MSIMVSLLWSRVRGIRVGSTAESTRSLLHGTVAALRPRLDEYSESGPQISHFPTRLFSVAPAGLTVLTRITAMHMFDFHYENVGKNQDIVAVVLSGTLDDITSDYLLSSVEGKILDGRKKLILDCRQLTYISSLGLGTLIRVNSRMKKIGGDVKLASVQGSVAQVMGVVGLNRVFQFYANVVDAIGAHGG
jgi:anti-sigma B factor antagonist